MMNESKRKEVLKWQRLLPSMLLALFAALYVELFREARIYYLNQAYAGILAGDYSQCNFGMMAGVFIGTAAVLLIWNCNETSTSSFVRTNDVIPIAERFTSLQTNGIHFLIANLAF